jgi:hypothetical protein
VQADETTASGVVSLPLAVTSNDPLTAVTPLRPWQLEVLQTIMPQYFYYLPFMKEAEGSEGN